jgi:hypothetical protein
VAVAVEIAGWFGAIAILAAHLSVSMGWLRPGPRFQAVNLLAAAAFIINGADHGAWPSVVTNVIWFLISAVALLRHRRVSKQPIRPPGTPSQTSANPAPTADNKNRKETHVIP